MDSDSATAIVRSWCNHLPQFRNLVFTPARTADQPSVVNIAQAITAIRIVLSDAQALQNARSCRPCRLPLTILIEIVTYLADIEPPLLIRKGDGSFAAGGLVTCTWVCRSWRNALLNAPTLWAGRVGQIPRAAAIFASRARQVPLTLSLSPISALATPEADVEDVACVLHVLDAVPLSLYQSISIAHSRDAVFQMLLVLCGQSSPSALSTLQTLNAHTLDWIPHAIAMDAPIGSSVIGPHLHIEAVRLQTISLTNCFVGFVCPSLHTLHIRFESDAMFKPTVDDVPP
ncbi:hypothetical protein K488DRAFT_92739 [Vararia minispora EC-137]|uniref:Uncharacterized protein n=1 Tax=Vararia minispora EC-137 TaxID=1314806 RepID=A0ACB8Q3S1_9AGAM|nr:hypothetical protein K488DRAFT_92739 [Vararia minispora EC-137]